MLCINTGLRKLKGLHIPILIIVSDRVVQEEIKEARDIINEIETVISCFFKFQLI